MLRTITDILESCNSSARVIPPTTLYNEGWLLRLVLACLHERCGTRHPLSFSPGARWYSEALLPSRFLPKPGGLEPRPESRTHADGVIGHFHFRDASGEVEIDADAKQFVVVEAKLGSPLASRTKHAPRYDQAARNVACIAHMLGSRAVENVAFYVVAPASQIECRVFGELTTKESTRAKVAERVSGSPSHEEWFQTAFLPALDRMKVACLSWESVIDALPDSARDIGAFYAECKRWNPPRRNGEASSPAVTPRRGSGEST